MICQPPQNQQRFLPGKQPAASSALPKADRWEDIPLIPQLTLHPFASSPDARYHFQRVADIGQLKLAVPALASAEPSTQIAFDLDDTLIAERSGRSTLVQPTTLKVLTSLQKIHNCFGLTARPYDSCGTTWLDLKCCGIDFAESAPWKSNPRITLPSGGYFCGVLYTGENNVKGDVLAAIVQHNEKLKHLVFIDDQPRNFVSMVMQAREISETLKLTCVWYTGDSTPRPVTTRLWESLVNAVFADDTAGLQRHDTAIRAARLRIKQHADSDLTRLSAHLRHSLALSPAPLAARLWHFRRNLAGDNAYDAEEMDYFDGQIHCIIDQTD